MRQAILEAGILKKRNSAGNPVLSFMSEPEAAALATLQRIEGRCDIEVSNSTLKASVPVLTSSNRRMTASLSVMPEEVQLT